LLPIRDVECGAYPSPLRLNITQAFNGHGRCDSWCESSHPYLIMRDDTRFYRRARSNYEENAMEIEQDEDGLWTVYSPMFDYMGCGKTQQEALDNFDKGLYATIEVRIEWGKSPI